MGTRGMMGASPMLSEPVEVYLAGWRSNTWQLSQAGWEISAEEDIARGAMRLAMHHRAAGITAITEARDWRYGQHEWFRMMHPVCHVKAFGADVRIHVAGLPAFSFQPIDPTPQVRPREILSLNDLCHFAKPKRLILPEAQVPDLLSRILEIQAPDAEARYLKLATQGMKLQPVAQLIGIAA